MTQVAIIVMSFVVGFVWAWMLRGFTLRKEIAQRENLVQETKHLLAEVSQQTTTVQNLIWQAQMIQGTEHGRWIN